MYSLSRHLAIILHTRAHSYIYVHYMPRGLLARAIISKRVQATNRERGCTCCTPSSPDIPPRELFNGLVLFQFQFSSSFEFRKFPSFLLFLPLPLTIPSLHRSIVRGRRCNFKFSPFDRDSVINPARVGKTVNRGRKIDP